MTVDFIIPDWPAPKAIKALSTTRLGGVSSVPYDSLNLATHVGDNPSTVSTNRHILTEQAHLPEPPRWLNQTHGTAVINSRDWQLDCDADACYSLDFNHVCTVMTADCLPVLICDKQAGFIAAAHAGWRGLADGIIEKIIAHYQAAPSDLMVWLGPAISPNHFEVGTDMYDIFTTQSAIAKNAFVQTDSTHYLADIYHLARLRIQQMGVNAIYGGDSCTVSDAARFFSYRRDGVCGRMASMIWIEN
ncbi:MAG: peptidoglycan editing factor PgeF [Gammaproteobacteria bacterium]|nr:peptidoglycan editing factor PgeF [Gammaproteobacteria bacterium]